MPTYKPRRRVFRKRGRKSFRKKATRSRRKVTPTTLRMSLPRNLVVPPRFFGKFHSNAQFYVPAASTSVGLFDVNFNSLHTPWNTTTGYDTAPRLASLSTPSKATNGFEGLANWLGASGSGAHYQSYRVFGAKITVTVNPGSTADTGDICIVPYKSGDAVNTTLYTACMAPFNKRKSFSQGRPTTVSMYMSVAKLWGVAKANVACNDQYQASGGADPTLPTSFRVLYGRGDGAVLSASLDFRVHLTVYGVLTNTTIGGQPESVV